MSAEDNEAENSKECDHYFRYIVVNDAFVKRYYRSESGQLQLDKLLSGLNVITSLEENHENSSKNNYMLLVKANSNEDLKKAEMKLSKALVNLNKRGSFTHLITLPFTNPTFVQSYLHFKESVLKNFSHCYGLQDALFQKPTKLHLTVSVLQLNNTEQIAEASQALQNECHRMMNDAELDLGKRIQVKGLSVMNTNPARAKVLYAKVEDEMLQQVVDRVSRAMYDASAGELMFHGDHGTPVKLHITLMNITFLRRKNWKQKKHRPIVKYFDCRPILEQFGEQLFVEMSIPCMQLNDVRAEDEHGYYQVMHSIQLAPSSDTTTSVPLEPISNVNTDTDKP